MENWKTFETECTNYLNKQYSKYADFINEGGSDSTIPDIKVVTKSNTFYIEVKEPNAQSGQFILLPDLETKEFMFSPKNKSQPNEFTEIITNYMNTDFDRFNSAGTSGQALDIDDNIFYNWIENYYSNKGVKFFITQGREYIILPVNKFRNYFDVSSKYRIKRSGSSESSIKYRQSVLKKLKEEYEINDYTIEGKKLLISSNLEINKIRFVLGNYEYYLAEKENGIYEVRQLSNTYNMNVIFAISLKTTQITADLLNFEKALQ